MSLVLFLSVGFLYPMAYKCIKQNIGRKFNQVLYSISLLFFCVTSCLLDAFQITSIVDILFFTFTFSVFVFCFGSFRFETMAIFISVTGIFLILFLLTDKILGMFFDSIDRNTEILISAAILYAIIAFLGYKKVKLNIQYLRLKLSNSFLTICFCLIFTINLLMTFIVGISMFADNVNYSPYRMLIALQLCVISILILILFCGIERERHREANVQQYQAWLMDVYESANCYRDSYLNYLYLCEEYCESKSYNSLKKLIDEEFEKFKPTFISTEHMEVISKIDSIAVRLLIKSKISTAQGLGIDLSVMFSNQLKYGELCEYEFITLLSNVFDVAIELAQNCENKYIKASVIDRDGELRISVKCSCEETLDFVQIQKTNNTSKSVYSGLNTIKSITDIYNDVFVDIGVDSEQKIFSLKVSILNEE